ncbi:class I SAM-dependent methyltransferase [Sinomonas terrae]|uniref:Methyltransferase domain-containing protein n=1 Tax=Sinomonas terrae TaxID=2908838 RepID=A0ABS9U1Y8_9MICC|nr:class I SAM-dependent methyltransferase [Sinomonas terrae]MCH6470412.1 methyltransferase domain-containing protein [Sinomonas terrae]
MTTPGGQLPAADPEAAKACCAAGYGADAVALLLGPSYHPGGAALTRRLARALGLGPGTRVLDVASGQGTTALLLAREFGCTVAGIDLGARQVEQARSAAAREGLGHLATFSVADAEDLPFEDGSFDALVCECALCTFPDKSRAAAEFARVLVPGGKAGITDVTVRGGRLPEPLTGMAAWVACIADARSPEGYAGLLEAAGLAADRPEDQSPAIARMLDQIEARLAVLAMAAPDALASAGIEPAAVRPYARTVRAEISSGTIGYSLITARKPQTSTTQPSRPTAGGTRP